MLSVIVDSVDYSLDDGTLCVLKGHDGWGAAPVRRFSSQGPLQDGDSDLGFQLEPRMGKLVLMFVLQDLDDMYTARQTMLSLFDPNKNLTLKWVMGYGTRQIDCKYYGDLGLGWEVRSWAAQRFAVTLKCNDPSFYDPVAIVYIFRLRSASFAFAVPSVVPTYVGTTTIDSTVNITYSGTWRSYPIITVTGPITSFVITNLTTGDKLDFSGYTVADGLILTIDCRYGYKTVIDSAGVSQIDQLTDDSDLATFHFRASSVNSFHVTGVDATGKTDVQMSYYKRYSGI